MIFKIDNTLTEDKKEILITLNHLATYWFGVIYDNTGFECFSYYGA